MKKKNLLLVVMAVFVTASAWALPVGSIIKKAAPLDVQVTNPGFPAGATVDFKAVTVDNKLWAKAVGTGYTLAVNPWSSQVRIYVGAQMHEISPNNDVAYITATPATRTTVLTAFPFNRNLSLPGGGSANFATFNQIAVLQEHDNNFNSTATWAFNQTAANSGLTETEKPVLTTATAGTQVGASLPLTLAATDDSGDFFYYISDAANNYHTILFESGTILGLTPDTEYNFEVVAIDYAGNISDPKFIQINGTPYESVVKGTAGSVEFCITSTANSFVLSARPTTPTGEFNWFGVAVNGGEVVDCLDSWSDNGSLFPGLKQFSKSFTGVTGDAEGKVRLEFVYIVGPFSPEPVQADEWMLFFEQQRKASTLTVGDRAGEFIEFQLGDSNEGDCFPRGFKTPTITKEVAKKQFFTIDGRAVATPTSGLFIVKKIFTDGSVGAEKVLIK